MNMLIFYIKIKLNINLNLWADIIILKININYEINKFKSYHSHHLQWFELD